MVAKRMNGGCRSSLWSINSLKSCDQTTEKGVMGILGFEVTSLMSKLVKLWQSLNEDTIIMELREEIVKSVGITNLVSLHEDYLITLSFKELIGDLVYVAKYVARLGKRCSNPIYHRLEQFFHDPLNNHVEWCGWEYRWKKMERKVMKMDKFISLMLQFTQEQQLLSEFDQTLRRMKANPSLSDKWKLYEFQKKLRWQRQHLRNIRDMSPWNRSYDYVVRLLARSIFTILDRMTFLLEGKPSVACRSHSLSYVHPSEPDHLSFLGSKKKGIYGLFTELYSNHGVVVALPSTVGSAALTLHYANIVVQVEKLAAGSPSDPLLGDKERHNLYNMLPTAIRDGLRGKLKKPCLDVEESPEGSVRKTLEWLAPIAHNTLKWYSDRSIIKQKDVVCGKNVLLVHTFYFADQGKAEATIIDLLVALNYVWRNLAKIKFCKI